MNVPETPLTTELVKATRDKDSWVATVNEEPVRIWTEPSTEESRVYVNVYNEHNNDRFTQVTLITGLVFVPAVMGGFRALKMLEGRTFIDMTEFNLLRLSYDSMEYCPMLLWDSTGEFTIFIPGDQSKLEYHKLTPEEEAELSDKIDSIVEEIYREMEEEGDQ